MGLFRAVATVGGYTLLSRVLGFIRDAMMAATLGAGPVSDAFFVALRLPNLFRSLFAEGAFSVAFIPLFTGRIETAGRDAAKAYADEAFSLMVAALFVMVVLAEIAMPWIIPLIAAGFGADPDQLSLATALTRITFPYLLFISLVALQGGVLNAINRFGAVAFTPALLNIFQITALLWSWTAGYAAETLCWAVTIGGAAQFLWLALSCRRDGMGLRLAWPRFSPDMRHLLGVMAPGIFGAGVTQINLLVSTNVASLLPTGSISYLQYADRLNQLPLAVVGIAVGTAILPTLSRHLKSGHTQAAIATQNRGLELAFLLTLPAACGLAILADPILTVLFQYGRFDAKATAATAGALAVYAMGLPAFVLIKVLAPAFYARHDTKTPVKIATASLVLNLVLTVALAYPLAHLGNALATSVAGWVNALGLFWCLRGQDLFHLDGDARRRLPRIAAASTVMALLLAFMIPVLHTRLHEGPIWSKAIALSALVGAGLIVYAGAILLFRVARLADLKGLIRKA